MQRPDQERPTLFIVRGVRHESLGLDDGPVGPPVRQSARQTDGLQRPLQFSEANPVGDGVGYFAEILERRTSEQLECLQGEVVGRSRVTLLQQRLGLSERIDRRLRVGDEVQAVAVGVGPDRIRMDT